MQAPVGRLWIMGLAQQLLGLGRVAQLERQQPALELQPAVGGLGGRRRVEHGQRLRLGVARPQRPRMGERGVRVRRVGLMCGSGSSEIAGWPAVFGAAAAACSAGASGPVAGRARRPGARAEQRGRSQRGHEHRPARRL